MIRIVPAFFAAASLVITTTSLASALEYQTRDVPVNAEVIANGLQNPWGLAFLPDGEALITERGGNLLIRSKDGSLSAPVQGMPQIAASGQGGLLDIAVAPDFESSGHIFFSFSEPGQDGSGTAVARATLIRDGGTPKLDDVEIVFSMSRKTSSSRHFGSRLVFSPDGTLFITTGDRGEADRSQDMKDHAGAVIRINTDGSIPADNPFTDSQEHLPEIWSKGHRNAQGAIWDTVTGGLLVVEHGAQGGDEINLPEAGKNYGWPVISYGRDYGGGKIGIGTEAEGYEQPAFYWDPSIAPSGLASYQGEMFPEWNGDLLVGALKFSLLSRLQRDEAGNILGEERMFEGEFGRIRDVRVAPDGSVWLLTDARNGQIIRLSRGS